MRSVGDVAKELLGVIKHRANDSDVGQMRAAMARMIGDDHVATVKRLAKRNRADAKAERP